MSNDQDISSNEYRLVPVDSSKETSSKEVEIDLFDLISSIWQNRSRVFRNSAIAAIIGVFFALITPKEYRSGATLIPEVTSSQSGANSLLQQYGGLLGVSGSFDQTMGGVISPQLYPSIVQSLPFQLELLNQEVEFTEYDTTITLYNFFDDLYRGSVTTYVVKYTLGLPGVVRGMFSDSGEKVILPSGLVADSVISVTFEQQEIIDSFQDRISVSLSEETGIVKLSVEMPDPNAAAQVAQLCIGLLKRYVTEYRTKKAQEDLDFAIDQMEAAKAEFTAAQNSLAEFQDSNLNMATARARTQEQRLESEYQLTFNVYNTLAQQVERAKLKVQEQTPVVSILQPVQIPVKKSKPKRSIMVLGFIFVSVFASVLYLIALYVFEHRRTLQVNTE